MRPSPALLSLVLVATGCGIDAPAPGEGTGWTVLHYTIADTDLEPFLLDDLTEMGEVTSSDDLNIRALVDRGGNYSSDGVLGLAEWAGAKVLDIADGGAEVVDDLGETNTGDPAVLAAFLAEGIRAHPAENYALVISDHGASWPGVGGDESADDDMLDLAEIRTAIADGLADAGVDKLGLLGFDACLMATYEVASTIARWPTGWWPPRSSNPATAGTTAPYRCSPTPPPASTTWEPR